MKVEGLKEALKWSNTLATKADKAASSALGRVGKGVATEVNRKVREEYTVKAGDVKNTIKVRPNGSNEVRVTSKGGSLSLPKFKVSPKAPTPGRRTKRVKATVEKGKTKPIKSGFPSAMNSGHIGIFRRTDGPKPKRKRNAKGDYPQLPISEGFGPAVPIMANKPEIVEHIEDEAERRMMDRLTHEIDRIMR